MRPRNGRMTACHSEPLAFCDGDQLQAILVERRTSRGVRKSARNFAAKSSIVAPSASAAATSARRASRSLSALGKSSTGNVARRSRSCVLREQDFYRIEQRAAFFSHARFCEQTQGRRHIRPQSSSVHRYENGCRLLRKKARDHYRKRRKFHAAHRRSRSC